MQHITLAEVKKNALEAFHAHRLGAQNGKRTCLYTYGRGLGCAIGVSFNEDTIKKILETQSNEVGIHKLFEYEIVSCPVNEEGNIDAIQAAHDGWCLNGCSSNEDDLSAACHYREEFLFLIGT